MFRVNPERTFVVTSSDPEKALKATGAALKIAILASYLPETELTAKLVAYHLETSYWSALRALKEYKALVQGGGK